MEYGGMEVHIHSILTPAVLMEVSGQIHTPTALSQGNETPVLLPRKLVGPQSQCLPFGKEKKAIALAGNRNRNPQLSTPLTEPSRLLGLNNNAKESAYNIVR